MSTDDIRKELFKLADLKYRDFQKKLIPTVDPESVIGVRTPALRKFAKQLYKQDEYGEFLNETPHKYFDENQLHAFIISLFKDYEICVSEVEKFLTYVDNWATCDQMSPKVFCKHRPQLLKKIKVWIRSEETYTVRFGTGMMMEHFLDEDFDPEYPKLISDIRSEEYYVNMMTAWYFATALAKQYDEVLRFIEDRKLDVWTHNKAIQKCVESNRIPPEHKEYLKTLKIRKKS